MDECKDIVHNVFVNLWQKQDELDGERPIKPYLFKAVHNRCLNHIRDRKKIVRHDLMMEDHPLEQYIESPDFVEQSELEMKVAKCIDELPDTCRQIFKLSRFEEKKYKEIAELLGISVKTVEGQMTKALKLLRVQLAEYLPKILIFWVTFIG